MNIIRRISKFEDNSLNNELDNIISQISHKDDIQKKISVIGSEDENLNNYEQGEMKVSKTGVLFIRAGNKLWKTTLTEV